MTRASVNDPDVADALVRAVSTLMSTPLEA